MSEGSLPPFGAMGPRSFPGAVGRVLGRLFGGPRRETKDPAPDPELSSRAAAAIQAYAEAHATLFERAQRLQEKAARLEEAGTPSESASNRAERARTEVAAGLAALRNSFAASAGGSAGRRAFDREIERRYPTLGLSSADL